MTAARTAKIQTVHQRPPPTPPGIALKKTFERTASPPVTSLAPWPRYWRTRQGAAKQQNARRIEPFENWPRLRASEH